jgi:hypothetical protein
MTVQCLQDKAGILLAPVQEKPGNCNLQLELQGDSMPLCYLQTAVWACQVKFTMHRLLLHVVKAAGDDETAA